MQIELLSSILKLSGRLVYTKRPTQADELLVSLVVSITSVPNL